MIVYMRTGNRRAPYCHKDRSEVRHNPRCSVRVLTELTERTRGDKDGGCRPLHMLHLRQSRYCLEDKPVQGAPMSGFLRSLG